MPGLTSILQRLAEARPVFHSEADFQHALAWELQMATPEASVRLEFRPVPTNRIYTDIWYAFDGNSIAIELKYVTRQLSVEVAGEVFELNKHSAHLIRRYDFVKDLGRVERIAEALPGTRGAAIMLTNDPSYWIAPRSGSQFDTAFRIHDGKILEGLLDWGAGVGGGTVVGRTEPIALRGSYRIQWQDYSTVGSGGFRYLLIELPS